MTDPSELTDLEGVTQHPGWHRIRERALVEFGPSGARYMEQLDRAVNTADKETALLQLQVLSMCRREIERFLLGIEARVRDLKASSTPQMTQSRRGML